LSGFADRQRVYPSDNSRNFPSDAAPSPPPASSRLLKLLPERWALRQHLSSDAATGKLHRRDNGHVIVIRGHPLSAWKQ